MKRKRKIRGGVNREDIKRATAAMRRWGVPKTHYSPEQFCYYGGKLTGTYRGEA